MSTWYNHLKRPAAVAIALLVIFSGLTWHSDRPTMADSQGIDFTVESITLSPESPAIGESVTITVAIKNIGTVNAGPSYVTCYVDETILATQSVGSLAAGTTITEAFLWQATTGTHTVRATADASGTVTETDETNNTRTFTFSTLAPDLIIDTISWTPTNPSKNDKVTFSITVKNAGNARATSTNVNLFIDGSSKGYQNVPALEPGSLATVRYEWYAPSGQHPLRAVVDENDNVREGNEGNNEYELIFSTSAPDLTIPTITYSPQTPSKNDQVTFTITITNQGSGRAESCFLGYFLDEQFQGSIKIATLEAGASSSVNVNATASGRSHTLKAMIDVYREIVESDENNNEKSVTIQTSSPDLVPKDITWSPSSPGIGDTLTFTATIKNEGSGRAEASRAAYSISGGTFSYVDIPALAAGAQTTVTFQHMAQFGEVNVTLIVNSDHRIAETNEVNNTITRKVSIRLPDLTISSITWTPINPAIGDNVTFTITATNLGGGKAQNFFLGYYIDDTLLSSELISSLSANTSISKTCTWEAKNGRHTFRAVADHNAHITENNEKNNENAVIIVPYMPDLTVGAVTWSPADMPAGSEVTFDIEIKNTGSLGAGLSRITYYLDDTLAGYQDIEKIAAGESVFRQFRWANSAGTHSIDIVIDSSNQVIEIDEDNNIKHLDLPPPDLTVKAITRSPEKFSIGETATFTARIVNQGKSKSLPTTLSCFVDGELLASQALPAIAAGGSFESSFAWTAKAGKHDVRITADNDNLVTEIDETNNFMQVESFTLTPDLTVEEITWYMENPLLSNETKFHITLKNGGSDITGEFRLKYYIDNQPEGDIIIGPLPAGETTSVPLAATLEAGEHTIYALVDDENTVIELDEANNSKSLSFNLIVPDLAVKSITLSPAEAMPGEKVTVTVKIENRGLDKAVGVPVSLSVNGSPVGEVVVETIDSGAVVPVTFTWKAQTGEIEFSAYADLDDLVLESNEANNSRTRLLTWNTPPKTAAPTIKVANIAPPNKGFFDNWWWLILLAGLILGGTAFISAYRVIKKESR